MKVVRLVASGVLAWAALVAVHHLASFAQPPQQPAPSDALPGDAVPEDPAPPPGGDAKMDVLARGPVHEAFADPVTFNPRETEVVEKKPPEPIKEEPPDMKPDGNVIWIPGYWAWDDERKDYLWISGAWRLPPANQRWVPGYWTQAQGGFKWVPGFWAAEKSQEVNYLPQPPETQEHGPNSATPGENYFWMPGNWYYQPTGYVWRPGYWTMCRENWVWMPARYYWTPSGYVYVPGYWDYPVVRRGWLFAPVYFRAGFYGGPRFVYRPAAVVDVNLLGVNLFVRPRYGFYYFGDYYGPAYATVGFYPWFRYGAVGIGYDPIFTYQHWYYRHDPRWEAGIRADFALRVRDPGARPARLMVGVGVGGVGVSLAMPLRTYVARPEIQGHFEHLSEAQRVQHMQAAQAMHEVREQRELHEVKNAGISHAGAVGHASLKLPPSGNSAAAGSRTQVGGATSNRSAGRTFSNAPGATGVAGPNGATGKPAGAQPLAPGAARPGAKPSKPATNKSNRDRERERERNG